MIEHDFGEARATVLAENGELYKAAEIRAKEGDVLEALRLLVKDNLVQSAAKAVTVLLDDLWRHLSFAIHADDRNSERLAALFDLADQLDWKVASREQNTQVNQYAYLCKEPF